MSDQLALLKAFVKEETLNLEGLVAKLRVFNPFEVLGVTHTEIRHSNVLGWLLDPRGSHGGGGYFLRKVMELVIDRSNVTEANQIRILLDKLEQVEVRREWRNLDVVVILRHLQFVMMIENKVHASRSGADQLTRYANLLEDHFPKPDWQQMLVYLSPFPRELTVDELDYNYVNVLHSEIVVILEEALQLLPLEEEVTQFIQYYIKAVSHQILMNSDEIKLAQEIYARHREAIEFIMKHKPNLNWNAMHNVIWDYLTKRVADFEVFGQKKDNDLVRFLPKQVVPYLSYPFHSWNSAKNIALAIEIFIEADHVWIKFCMGRIWNPQDGEQLQDVKAKLHELMSNFESTKADYRPAKVQRADKGYITEARYWLIWRKDALTLPEADYASFFEKKFVEFEEKLLKPWTEEVLRRVPLNLA